ncbi:MAG: hypothetical protein GDA48_21165 [Hormoscilla sp. GM102CHS1]|nr:hypothetical protein [Hormoscilla sp. GM102CHS1]
MCSVFAALAVLAVRIAEVIPEMKAEQFGFLLASAGIGLRTARADIFVVHAGHRGRDTITDFTLGTDSIMLTGGSRLWHVSWWREASGDMTIQLGQLYSATLLGIDVFDAELVRVITS